MHTILKINKTEFSPEVIIDTTKGLVEITGKCMPENSSDFFKPIISKLENINTISNSISLFVIKIENYNISSIICLLDMLKILAKNKDCITIKWFVNKIDYDTIETGKILEHLTHLKFQFIITESILT